MVASTKAERHKPPVFHEVEISRGWRILQQHLALSLSLHHASISGIATFQITPLNHRFVNVALNLRRCRVRACKIAGQPAPFKLISPLDDQELLDTVSSNPSHHRVADIEHSISSREDAASMQGELVIDLPANISADIIDDLKEAFKKSTKNDSKPDDEYEEPSPDAIPPVPLEVLPRLSLTVEYEVLDHTASGVHFGLPTSSKPLFDPTYMLTDGRYGMARLWMPCIDSMLWCDRYLFDFDITVESDLTVITSGELIETCLVQPSESSMQDDNQQLKLFKYRSHAPSHASEIVLAVGPFIPLPDPSLPNTVTHFCLPGRVHELVHTGPPLFAKALAFCRDYFGADPPCSSFKQVFVGSLGMRADSTIAGAGGLVVHSGDFLHTGRCIDEGLAAREAIMIGLVTSYFGRFLRPRSAEDDWLITGLAAHVASLGLQAILGRNWYRFRILDLMDELRFEASCDLSDIKINRVTDATVDSVRRRSHIIVYMIERRIGNDVMKRALRDIVAEGRSVTIATVALIQTALAKAHLQTSSFLQLNHERDIQTSLPPHSSRILRNLNGDSHMHNSGGGVVSSGFDEALQGVSVGPFLKRLRAICGTDLRSLVRLWAASPGIPRLQIGYQYNPRRHTIEFVMKQEAVEKGARFNGRQGLPFTGTINVRVMEIEGASDHSVEIRDHIFVTELPCHSRRAKHKSAAQAEKEFNENPARASPVLWVRVDPELEWCKDVHFNQSEDSWMALLKGERDALGQFEACRGLAESSSEMGGKALLSILEDGQIYWRVRAECAKVLAQCPGGLPLLLQYFRSCYTDNKESNSGIVRLNNFSSFADYYVKRAMIKAIAGARVLGSRSGSNSEASVPPKATEFISHILAGNDNAGNDFDDDYYVVDLLQTAAELGVRCVDDKMHVAKEGGISGTDSIAKQLERYRSIEQLIPSRSGLTVSATITALANIEAAKLRSQDIKERGAVSRSIMMSQFSPNCVLVRLMHDLSHWRHSLDTRISVMMSLAEIYGGDLEVTLWLLTRVDSTSYGQDIQDSYLKGQQAGMLGTSHGFTESATLRYKLLDALSSSASSKKWYGGSSPLLLALRRHTKRAMDVCVRVLRLSVSDSDPRVRASAIRFAKIVWGKGIPVCLLSQMAYSDAKRHAIRFRDRAPVDIVELKTNGNITVPHSSTPVKTPKQGKVGKSSKPPKIADSSIIEPISIIEKVPKKKFAIPRSQVSTAPLPKPPKPLANGTKIVNEPPINVDEIDRRKKTREGPGLQLRSIQPPAVKVKPAVIDVDTEPPPVKLQIPRSVQSFPVRSRRPPEVKLTWDPLDKEDLEFLKRAREIEKTRSASVRKEKQEEKLNTPAGEGLLAPKEKSENTVKSGEGEHKKKKKKKKKRHLEGGEDGGHKKKKKKKKKREDGQKYAEVEPEYDDGLGDFDNGSSSMAGAAAANGERKIGKFRIKLSSVAPAP